MDSRTVKKTDFCMLFGVIHVTLVCLFAGGMTTYILFVLTTSEPERVYEHLPYVLQISSMVVLAIVPPISYSILKQRRALHLANEKLEFLVRIDQLTGLLSRGTFFEEVEGILENSDKENVCNAIAFLDIDHFKKINDRHGHAAGDDVLRQLGRVFGDVLQPNEIAGRIGGEEFAIFIPDCTNKQAWQKIQRLVDVFKKLYFECRGCSIIYRA